MYGQRVSLVLDEGAVDPGDLRLEIARGSGDRVQMVAASLLAFAAPGHLELEPVVACVVQRRNVHERFHVVQASAADDRRRVASCHGRQCGAHGVGQYGQFRPRHDGCQGAIVVEEQGGAGRGESSGEFREGAESVGRDARKRRLQLVHRQLLEVGHDEMRPRVLQRFRAAVTVDADHQPERATAPGLHPRNRVLDDDAPVAREAEPFRGRDEDVWRRLAPQVECLARQAVDPDVEQRTQPGTLDDLAAVLARGDESRLHVACPERSDQVDRRVVDLDTDLVERALKDCILRVPEPTDRIGARCVRPVAVGQRDAS